MMEPGSPEAAAGAEAPLKAESSPLQSPAQPETKPSAPPQADVGGGKEPETELEWAPSSIVSPRLNDAADDKVGLLAGSGTVGAAGAGAGVGAAAGAGGAAAPTADSSTAQGLGAKACPCLSVEYYKPLFDVDTADVRRRVLRSCWPFAEQSFFEEIAERPDLYGPVWICTTLVFVVGVASNIATWLNIDPDKAYEWHYDFTLMTGAAGVAFGFVSIVPVLLWAMFKYTAVPLSLTKLLCLYGYSIVVFIPAAVLCLTPSVVMDWVAVVVAAAVSTGLLLVNSYPVIAEHANTSAKAFAVIMGCSQLLFGLILKLFFFHRLSIA